MKKYLWLLCMVTYGMGGIVPTVSRADSMPVEPSAMWKQFEAAKSALSRKARESTVFPPGITSGREKRLWLELQEERLRALALELFEILPSHDPRRWDALIEYLQTSTEAAEIADYREVEPFKWPDESALNREAMVRRFERTAPLWFQLCSAEDVAPRTLERGLSNFIRLKCDWARYLADPDLEEVKRQIEWATGRLPESKRGYYRENWETRFRRLLLKLGRNTEATERAHQLATSEWPEVADWAHGVLRSETAQSMTLELTFTAIDGRSFDLADYRGKVVLIDFWATWCEPCVKEMPYVKAAYKKFHNQGFEVIGISFDKASDRQKLLDFCRDQGLPWLQYFDGKHWKNEVGLKFSIKSLPTMWVIDQSGRLATVLSYPPGEKLEAEIRRLLGSERRSGALEANR